MFIQRITGAGKAFSEQATKYFNDAQLVKKTGQIIADVLALIVIIDPLKQKPLSRLTTVILSVNLVYGFRFLKLPQMLFLSVHAESINEFAVVELLTSVIAKKKYPEDSNRGGPSAEQLSVINRFLQPIVEKHLKSMLRYEEEACRNIDQFLQNLLVRLKMSSNQDISHDLLGTLTIDDLRATAKEFRLENALLRPSFLLDKVLAAIWVVVDIGSLFCYLKDWQLVDTAKLAAEMGRYSILSFVKEMNLELFVLGSVCAGYVLDVIESIRKLHDHSVFLSSQEKHRAYRNIVTSSLEALLFAGFYISVKTAGVVDPFYIRGIGIVSRLVGIVMTSTAREHKFFLCPQPITEVQIKSMS